MHFKRLIYWERDNLKEKINSSKNIINENNLKNNNLILMEDLK